MYLQQCDGSSVAKVKGFCAIGILLTGIVCYMVIFQKSNAPNLVSEVRKVYLSTVWLKIELDTVKDVVLQSWIFRE